MNYFFPKIMRLFPPLLILISCFMNITQAEVFKCKTEGGKMTFSDKPCPASQTQEIVKLSGELTEEDVKNLISKVDKAVNAFNAQGVADTLSSDVEIIMHISFQGITEVMKPSKQEYLVMLKEGWEMSTNYKYSRSNLVVNIKKNSAFVTADVNESMTIQGQHVSGQSKEEVTVEMVNGVPLITKVIGYTSM